MKLAHRREEHFLNEVIHLARRHASEKDAVDHSGITVIEAAEGGTVASAGCADEGVILARFGDGPGSHNLTFHATSPKVNAVSHDQAMKCHCLIYE
jgi:hypothetical protein